MNWFDKLKKRLQEAWEEAQSPKVSLGTAQVIVPDFFNQVDRAEEDGHEAIGAADQLLADANKILAKERVQRSKGQRKLTAVKRVRKALGE